jgi:AcrR family transcriptional regulator
VSSATAPPPRGRPRRAELDDAILDACFAVLSAVGYARMSVDAVARRAGVTRPTVYRRWSGKEELAIAALSRAQAGIVDLPDTGDVRHDLVAQLRSLRQTLTRPHGMAIIGSMLAEEHTSPALLAGFRAQVVAQRRAPIHRILARLGRGEPATEAAVDLLVGACYAAYVAGGGMSDAWVDTVVDLLVGGPASPISGSPGSSPG